MPIASIYARVGLNEELLSKKKQLFLNSKLNFAINSLFIIGNPSNSSPFFCLIRLMSGRLKGCLK